MSVAPRGSRRSGVARGTAAAGDPDTLSTSVLLYRGECLEVMGTRVPAASVDLIVADLPYAVTNCSWDSPIPLDRLWAEYERITKPAAVIVLTAVQPFAATLVSSKPAWFRYEWIWEKPQGTNPLNASVMPLRRHENVLVFSKQRPPYYPQMEQGFRPIREFVSGAQPVPVPSLFDEGTEPAPPEIPQTIGEVYGPVASMHRENTAGTRYPTSILRFKSDKAGQHPTQKPVALMRYLIRTYTREGATVLDNVMGSGTTGVAAVLENRSFVGVEREERYFSTAAERINTHAGHLCSTCESVRCHVI